MHGVVCHFFVRHKFRICFHAGDTMKVGANLNSQGYGIGMPMDSDLK